MGNSRKKRDNNRKIVVTTLALLVIIFGILFLVGYLSEKQKEKQKEDQPTASENAKDVNFEQIYATQPSVGAKEAPIKIVEFFDFKCPSCKAFEDKVYQDLKKEYIDSGKVQLFFMNYQFIGEDSTNAGIFGEAIHRQNPALFPNYKAAVFKNQGDESKDWATKEFLTDLIKKELPQINIEQLLKDVEDPALKSEVENDKVIGRKLGVLGTPGVIVNGELKSIENDYKKLKEIIELELVKKQ